MSPLRASLIALAAACAVPAAAQEVRIESGEHADFSRLVFYFPDEPDWRMRPAAGGGYTLSTDRDYNYRTDGVFDLIPRDRISGLRARDGELLLDLACACTPRARALSPTILVVDVGDGPVQVAQRPRANPRRDQFTAAESVTPATSAADRLRDRWREAIARRTASADLGVVHEPRPATVLPGGFQEARRANVPYRGAARENAPETPAPRADAIAGDLLRQISRAASQGLVQADLTQTRAAIERARTDASDALEPASTPAPAPEPAAAPVPEDDSHIEIHTSIDRALGRRELSQAADGTSCVSGEMLDVRAWKRSGFDGSDISRYRAELVDGRDEIVPEAVLDFARHLVALSFGAEARAVLELLPERGRERDLLYAMADIVENEQTSRPGPLAGQLACDNAAALWAALAEPDSLDSGEINGDAVVASFSALPLHLRRHLGPGLAERVLDADRTDLAVSLRNAIARAPGEHGPSFDLLDARVDLETGDVERGEAKLDALARSGRSPEALALALERGISDGEADPDLVERAGALARQLDGRPLAARLKQAELGGLIVSDAYDAALDGTARALERGTIEPAEAALLRARAYIRVAEQGDDADFLRLAFGAERVLGVSESERAARRALAERLLGHGLTDQAGALVNHPDVVPSSQDRLILAETALSSDRPDIALGYVMGMTGTRAEAIRDRIAGSIEQPVQPADPVSRTAQAEQEASQGMLARGRALLERSSARRDELQRLLASGTDPNS